jgi:hypothetical protein
LRALCPVIAFHCLVLVGAKNNALPIRKHEPLMTANFRDDVSVIPAFGE